MIFFDLCSPEFAEYRIISYSVHGMKKSPIDELQRLLLLAGTDEGFFILAVHSYVEGLANSIQPGFTQWSSFDQVIDLLLNTLEKRNVLTLDARKALVRIEKQHKLTHRVRHDFDSGTRDDVDEAIANFLQVCKAFSINSSALTELEESLSYWKERLPPIALARELRLSRMKLAASEGVQNSLLAKLSGYQEIERRLTELEQVSRQQAEALEQTKKTADQRGSKVDELRTKLRATTTERDELLERLEEQKAVGDYLQYLERFTNYTRTRVDYERSVMRLTAEQEEAVALVKSDGDYVIKGTAGTGKTLVLLHALERYLDADQLKLDLARAKPVVLLTYTKTLAKYSTYLAAVVGHGGQAPAVLTADSYLMEALKKCRPGFWMDFKLPDSLCAEYNTTSFLSDEELAVEIEDVLWGNLITRDEYLEKHILRRGMKQPLSAAQRQVVWEIQERMRDRLIAEKRISRNLACALIVQNQADTADRSGIQTAERIFVDEAQDLSTATIRALRCLSARGLVIAADDGQSLYKIGAQYQRAGLLTAGHVRILKTNFRNTRQIHELAERFLSTGSPASSGGAAEDRVGVAYREGPFPEIVRAGSIEDIFSSLLQEVGLCCTRLGYDPENIGILAPTNAILDQVRTRLTAAGYTAEIIKEDHFDFQTTGVIRLSTLHSSKGIEFPVVLLFLPVLGFSGSYDERTSETMQRNLLYVALTRAMDLAVLFSMEQIKEPVLAEFAAAIEAVQSEPAF